MTEATELSSAIFFKTELGHQEIQKRSLGLTPLVRRLLLLADGKRSGAELAAFAPNQEEAEPILRMLLSLECLQAKGPPTPSPKAKGAAATGPTLEPAELRTPEDNEKARNFMINSVNVIMGQHTRVTLITDIANAQGTDALRAIYKAWEASMSDHGTGSKRLPELREKLFKVL